MEKERVEQIKMELIDNIENGSGLSVEASQDILDMLENIYRDSSLSKDTTPMIGTNPFRSSDSDSKSSTDKSSKDFNDVLNYRVQKFNEFDKEEGQ